MQRRTTDARNDLGLTRASAGGVRRLSRRDFTTAAALSAAMGVAAPLVCSGQTRTAQAEQAPHTAQAGWTDSDAAQESQPIVTFSGDGLVLTRTETGYRALTPYFSLDLPDSWLPGGFDASYDDRLDSLSDDGTLLFGHTLNITLPPIDMPAPGNTFFVMCHSADWSGVQGEFSAQDIGPSLADPSLVVGIYASSFAGDPDTQETAKQLVEQYAALVDPALATAQASSQAARDAGPYAYLSGLYARLDGFGSQVVGIAQTFNNDFLADGLDRAYEQIQTIDRLQATLRAEYRNLLALQLAPGDDLYEQTCESLILVNDLQERLVPIRQAWTVRLRWPHDAKPHTDEIVAPLAQDLDSNGISLFKLDFEARYSRANPDL